MSQLRRVLIDENDVPLVVDDMTTAFTTIDYSLNRIHEGKSFYSQNIQDLANAATYDYHIVTPNTTEWAHLTYKLSSEAETTIQVYLNSLASDDGTLVSVFNRNANSSNVNTTLLYETPTITNLGTLVASYKTGSGKSAGGMIQSVDGIVLRQNAKYLIRITNATSSNNWVDINLSWLEHVSVA